MAEPAAPKMAEDELLRMTAEVVSAYVSNNTLATGNWPMSSRPSTTRCAVWRAASAKPVAEPLKPAVPIRKSITPEYLICLEDGKKLKMLKRHLRSTYNLTPGRIPHPVGPAAGLSDGCAEIRRAALGIRQEDRSRARHRAQFGPGRDREKDSARSRQTRSPVEPLVFPCGRRSRRASPLCRSRR